MARSRWLPAVDQQLAGHRGGMGAEEERQAIGLGVPVAGSAVLLSRESLGAHIEPGVVPGVGLVQVEDVEPDGLLGCVVTFDDDVRVLPRWPPRPWRGPAGLRSIRWPRPRPPSLVASCDEGCPRSWSKSRTRPMCLSRRAEARQSMPTGKRMRACPLSSGDALPQSAGRPRRTRSGRRGRPGNSVFRVLTSRCPPSVVAPEIDHLPEAAHPNWRPRCGHRHRAGLELAPCISGQHVHARSGCGPSPRRPCCRNAGPSPTGCTRRCPPQRTA